jgi:hypothetical protein
MHKVIWQNNKFDTFHIITMQKFLIAYAAAAAIVVAVVAASFSAFSHSATIFHSSMKEKSRGLVEGTQ